MKLLEFPHSHFCEKARWALDYKSIPYKPVPIIPGLHMLTVRRYATDTSVPVLLHNETAIQGSSEIITWLDQKYPAQSLTPTDPDLHHACLKLEADADKLLGENIRQILYQRLLAYPDFVRYCFMYSMARYKKLIFYFTYPVLRYKIYQTYVISDQAVEQATKEFDATLDMLAKRLNNRQYFIGDQFSRADLTIASMLAFIGMPSQHPFPWIEIPDPQTRAFIAHYQQHPVIKWANTMYALHRNRLR